jgi:large subunit ribosomal protein L22
MEIKVSLNYLRMTPRKIRLVTRLISGMSIQEAEKRLKFLNKRATKPILKLLNSAIASAKNNFDLDEKRINTLYIKTINVNEGPKLKRWMPVSRGTAHPIQKKTSHIAMILDEKGREGDSKHKGKNKPQR